MRRRCTIHQLLSVLLCNLNLTINSATAQLENSSCKFHWKNTDTESLFWSGWKPQKILGNKTRVYRHVPMRHCPTLLPVVKNRINVIRIIFLRKKPFSIYVAYVLMEMSHPNKNWLETDFERWIWNLVLNPWFCHEWPSIKWRSLQ